MSKQTLKLRDTVVNKKEFRVSKQAIALNLINRNKIVISEKFKYRNDGSKFFIGYLHDYNVTRPLCIILSQMKGYMKYFDNGGKNISFKIEDESVYLKYMKSGIKLKSH